VPRNLLRSRCIAHSRHALVAESTMDLPRGWTQTQYILGCEVGREIHGAVVGGLKTGAGHSRTQSPTSPRPTAD
jgi:hypothetical protein